jgi:hypothetical protein
VHTTSQEQAGVPRRLPGGTSIHLFVVSQRRSRLCYLHRQERLVRIIRVLFEERSNEIEVRRAVIVGIEFSYKTGRWTSELQELPTRTLTVPRTAIQEHFDSGREAVDAGFDSLEGLVVGNRVDGPSEHHQAMLDGQKISSEQRC